MGGPVHGDTATDHAALLALALSRPLDAVAAASRWLDTSADPCALSVAHQTLGIVARDSGRADEAVAELRAAMRSARACGDPRRLVDVRATMGTTLALNGHTAAGLRQLDAAARHSDGLLGGQVLMRRGAVLGVLGRHDEALRDLGRATTLLRAAGDPMWEGRCRTHRGMSYLALGQTDRAERDFVISERLLTAAGQDLEIAWSWHSRARVAQRRGELPTALRLLDRAAERYAALATSEPELAIDRCNVLLAAGLAADALRETDGAIAAAAKENVQVTRKAELLFAAATAALAAASPAVAAQRAAAAHDLFRQQARTWWQLRASFVLLSAQHATGARDARLATRAADLAHRLGELRAAEAARAYLFAGRLALEGGREAETLLGLAAGFRRSGAAIDRATGWLAKALWANGRGQDRETLLACGRGLAAVEDQLRHLGAQELRAHATAHGAQLAAVAQRLALRRRDARMLLRWSERWRASAFAMPAARPPDDPQLTADLAALRAVGQALDVAREKGRPTGGLDGRRIRLEAAIRARTRRVEAVRSPMSGPGPARPSIAEIVAALGELRLLEIIELDGLLHVVTVANGRVRLHPAGSVRAAEREVQFARFLLRRLALGQPPPGFTGRLAAAGQLLEETLLGAAARELDGGPVLVVPPGSLHAVPWSLLPSLRTSAVRVAPSATAWLAAHRATPPRRRRVALVVGPGLEGTAAEVRQIATGYPGPVVLRDGQATAERTLALLDDAWLAHVAAHGTFRADSPLFSSLRLDDGPLTVYDLARLRRAPYQLVLASCESAVGVPVGADELVGMVGALIPKGTASLLASVVPVNDAATAPLMVEVHARLRAGVDLAQALSVARAVAVDDPAGLAAGLAFVALGR
ncbi:MULTISPECIES: CHAT domain-containing protein [Pseudofrankia]|uniref:CHAT domain-containing protein n=1 Tax=Pseudofrankia TaxID=2994363 RepID=UPI000234B3D1|nr:MULTISPECIES: CHAT domain-containing protein [Pseudofrankia]OHV39329.1 hypothetical protein BCD49_11615 [Pseudofrankia sp. EUN1h]